LNNRSLVVRVLRNDVDALGYRHVFVASKFEDRLAVKDAKVNFDNLKSFPYEGDLVAAPFLRFSVSLTDRDPSPADKKEKGSDCPSYPY